MFYIYIYKQWYLCEFADEMMKKLHIKFNFSQVEILNQDM